MKNWIERQDHKTELDLFARGLVALQTDRSSVLVGLTDSVLTSRRNEP
jgi:hypothetical protein